MGKLNVNCGISNLSLYNQRTSVLLLLPSNLTWFTNNTGEDDEDNRYYPKLKSDMGIIFSNGKICGYGGCMEHYYPFAFPIHGTYHESESFKIKDIVRDKNVEILEKYFNTSIENILQYIDHSRHYNAEYEMMLENMSDEARKFYINLNKAYYRTEVLEHLQEGNWNQYLNKPEEEMDWNSLNIVREVNRYLKLIDREKGEPLLDENELIEYRRLKLQYDNLDENAPEALKHSIGASIASLTFGGHYMYFPTTINTYQILPITKTEFEDELIKQVSFVINVGEIGIQLKPSTTSAENINHDTIFDLNNTIQDLLIIDRKKYHEEHGEVPYATEGNLLNTVSLGLIDSEEF